MAHQPAVFFFQCKLPSHVYVSDKEKSLTTHGPKPKDIPFTNIELQLANIHI